MFPFEMFRNKLPAKYFIGDFLGLLGTFGLLMSVTLPVGLLFLLLPGSTPPGMIPMGCIGIGIALVFLPITRVIHGNAKRWLRDNT